MAHFDPCSVDEHTFEKENETIQRRRAATAQRNEKKSDDLKKLYIEPTSKCNLACTMCFRNTWFDEAFADMDTSVFDSCMNTMPESVETVFFGGMGEPLHHKDIIYMVQSASGKGKRVELLTNGTLLTPEMVTNLLDAGLDMLWVSIDSFETEGYENIRQHSNFLLIKSNIRSFNRERQRRDSEAQLGIAFVAMKSNINQIGRLVQFANENNVSKVNISNVIPTDSASVKESLYNRTVSLELYTQNSAGYPEISMPFVDFNMTEAREGFMEMLRSNCNIMLGGESFTRRKRYCRFIEEGTTFVRHDGDVSPCMALLHSGITYLESSERKIYHHSFGNAKEKNLEDIWLSEEYTAFRERVRKFEFSPCIQCGGCENRDDNCQDCLGNQKPTCGACLWSEGIISCP
jgi:MoaA/NifB/PqqE/SkfB family radical SAM enzyme